MPVYEYLCTCGNAFDRYLPLERYKEPQSCDCGQVAEKQISRPMMVSVKEIRYESPIDGRPITTLAQRKEDLARSGCIEYDPEMKTDYNRRIERDEKQLEAKIEDSVNSQIAKMPARKREKLNSELNSGIEVTTERLTA